MITTTQEPVMSFQEAIKIFNCIETLDSEKLAIKIDKECRRVNRIIEIMIEINLNEENK